MTNFTDFNLSPSLLKALPENITRPTTIQQLAIPPALNKQDILALAQTGSGKTLAFGLPLIHTISAPKQAIQALIIVPTRELANQIETNLSVIAIPLAITTVTLCGGVSQVSQMDKIRAGAQLIIATPGRLSDLLQQQLLDMQHCQQVVLDEADRLLEMGFWPEVTSIIRQLPLHQAMLFSATLNPNLESKAHQLLKQPVTLQAHSRNSAVDTIKERLYLVNKGSKAKALQWLIERNNWSQILVFISARDSADAFAKKLRKAGLDATALHGEKDQQQRQLTLSQFKEKTLRIIVATDVLARGIDIESLPVVINLDLPSNAPVYVHRIGRTARAGQQGLAISLISHSEMDALSAIRKLTERELPVEQLAEFPVTDKPASATSKRAPRDKQANRRTTKRRNERRKKPRD